MPYEEVRQPQARDRRLAEIRTGWLAAPNVVPLLTLPPKGLN